MSRGCAATRLLLIVGLLGGMRPSVHADDLPPLAVLSGESRKAANLLDDVRKQLADKQWPQALDGLQALLNAPDDGLVPVNPRHDVQMRRLCHVLIANLPPDVLTQYRDRVEAQAKRWLEQGLNRRDEAALRKVVDEAFCSRPGEKALEALGDLAFERGDFIAAEQWWRLLVPLVPVEKAAVPDKELGVELTYPGPQGDPARVRAKQLLARLFQGQGGTWAEDLKAFRALHPKATGNLAGKQGPYTDTLAALGDIRPESPLDTPWTTFGGDPSRGLLVPAPQRLTDRLGLLCRQPRFFYLLEERRRLEKPPPADRWHKALDAAQSRREGDKLVTATSRARSFAFHPVITDRHVLFADAQCVLACDLRSGDISEWYDASRSNGGLRPDLKLPAPADLRYTLTVADGCVYARLGAQVIRRPEVDPANPNKPPRPARDKAESLLVCLSLTPLPDGERLLWQVRPGIINDNAVFEGAPLVHNGLVYIAATRFVGDRVVTAVHCYPANLSSTPPFTPALRWRKDVCETREVGGELAGEGRYRHHLLTLAGPNVVYCSHTGAVMALDAATGRHAWGMRYPRKPIPLKRDDGPLTDLAPCLAADGRLYVAPADSDTLFCLDPATGQLLWHRDLAGRLRVVHLLGVGLERLIFTTPEGLRAVRASDGSDEGGWSLPDVGGKLPPLGRGLLIGDLVLWPTDRGVFAIRQLDGRQPDNPTLLHGLPPGNLAIGHGCLAVADRATLSIFTPPALWLQTRGGKSELLPGHRQERNPALLLLDLAIAQADAGQTRAGFESLAQAERLAGALPEAQWSAVRQRVVAERHRILLDAATRSENNQRWEEAAEALQDAGSAAFPPRLRLQALLRKADLWKHAGKRTETVAAWQAVLSTPALRRLPDPDGLPAEQLASGQISRLCCEEGSYDEIEKRAAAALAVAQQTTGSAEERVTLLEQLADEFPHAMASRTALRELAQQYDKAGLPGAAAHTYRRLLVNGVCSPSSGKRQALVEAGYLLGLARAYEKQHCWEAARITWQRLQRAHGELILNDLDARRTVQEAVAVHLHSGPLQPGNKRPPPLTLPLERIEQLELDGTMRVLPVANSTGPIQDLFFCVHPEGSRRFRLICRMGLDNTSRWERFLSFCPRWLTSHADMLLVSGRGGLAGVCLDDGRVLWEISHNGKDKANQNEQQEYGALHCVGGRLYVLEDKRRLLALDAPSGRVLWTRWAPAAELRVPLPGSRFFPDFLAGETRVLVQATGGRGYFLDAVTGQVIREFPTREEPWSAVVHGETFLVRDGLQVLSLDLHGRETWTFALPERTFVYGDPPQLRTDSDSVFLLGATSLGYELHRLAVATGKPVWPRPLRIEADQLELSGWSVGEKTLYFVRDQRLSARSLADGKVLWERHLPELRGGWKTRLMPGEGSKAYLLVYPGTGLGRRITFRWLTGSVQWTMAFAPEAQIATGCPLLVCDPATGDVLQKWTMAVNPVRLCDAEKPPGFTLWPKLRVEPTPVEAGLTVAVTGPGLRLTRQNQVWEIKR
jgi:outer membrane protein assembly factor BamB